jgi:serine/threonine protein kinase
MGQLGDFRLLREIGRGGMGVVYEAEQISLRRRVALKVLPFASAIDPRQLQRFQNEAQAAAQLRHEHIIPVFAIGTDRGVHYFAMQYIDGQSLAELIEELRPPDPGTYSAPAQAPHESGVLGPTGPFVSPLVKTCSPNTARTRTGSVSREAYADRRRYFRWVASLGRQAALALEHAHLAGIVHRDIKPGNLLLDAAGELWVADFGLARFGTDGRRTLTIQGEMLGTLRYASPEQALARRGVVDHRSDIYSLGATLYELLTLRPIFDGRDQNELLRQIAFDDPIPVRKVDRAIPEELETIILKAVAKEPGDRYPTAQDLADDLERFLGDHPILARRPSLAEKAMKWARRHRAVMASALAALLITMAGLAIATILTAQAYDRERKKAQEAEDQRTRAEESFRQAWHAVDRFARIDESELVGRPGLEQLRQHLLETALAYYSDFLDQRRDDPSSQKDLKASRAKATRILGELATLRGAARYFLLHLTEVQDELDLSDDKRAALNQIERRWREGFQGAFGQDPETSERRSLTLARELEADVSHLLTPKEFQRLSQIALQFQGPKAFSDPAVVEKLRLTPEQRERIQIIRERARPHGPLLGPPGREPGRPFAPPDESRLQQIRKLREKAVQEIVTLLTKDQQAKWRELVGKDFMGKVGVFPSLPPFPG